MRWVCGIVAAVAIIMVGECSWAQVEGRDYVLVCKDAGAGGYQAFPDVCRMTDGRLVCVFYAGYTHGSTPTGKLPDGGRIAYCTSDDQGRTWSAAQTLYDGPLDDRDPSVTQLPDGRLLCVFFQASHEQRAENGVWLVESSDGAKTWGKARQVVRNYGCSSPIRRLSTGRLVLPMYREGADGTNGAVMLSDDGGQTWGEPINIDNAGKYLDAETDVIELRDGKLLAVQRGGGKADMHIATSADRGVTWTKSEPIGFRGHCPYLHRAPNGAVLLGTRELDPNYTALRFSMDEGRTWSRPQRCDGVGGAYPSMVTLRDGAILIVYYEEGEGSKIRARRFAVSEKGMEFLPISPASARP